MRENCEQRLLFPLRAHLEDVAASPLLTVSQLCLIYSVLQHMCEGSVKAMQKLATPRLAKGTASILSKEDFSRHSIQLLQTPN